MSGGQKNCLEIIFISLQELIIYSLHLYTNTFLKNYTIDFSGFIFTFSDSERGSMMNITDLNVLSWTTCRVGVYQILCSTMQHEILHSIHFFSKPFVFLFVSGMRKGLLTTIFEPTASKRQPWGSEIVGGQEIWDLF